MTQAVSVQVKPFYPSSNQCHAVHELLDAAGWAYGALPSFDLLTDAARRGMAFVAKSEDGNLVGFVRIISDGATVSYVAEIAVDPEWQRQGIGQALLEACASRFPTARLDLLSTEAARPFYEHVNFIPKPGYRRWPQ